MNGTLSNIGSKCKRYFLVFAAMLLVLLSSCSIKSGIKSLAGIPVGTERTLPKSNQYFSSGTVETCAEFDIEDTQIVQKFSFNANDLQPVAFLKISKENRHPVYSGSSKIRSTIPIFLEYQKLILHFSH